MPPREEGKRLISSPFQSLSFVPLMDWKRILTFLCNFLLWWCGRFNQLVWKFPLLLISALVGKKVEFLTQSPLPVLLYQSRMKLNHNFQFGRIEERVEGRSSLRTPHSCTCPWTATALHSTRCGSRSRGPSAPSRCTGGDGGSSSNGGGRKENIGTRSNYINSLRVHHHVRKGSSEFTY